MRKTIDKKVYNTDTATSLGRIFVGDFGQPDGYEEQLFVNKAGQHFIYGIGGSESKYPRASIELITDKEATKWKKGNKIT